MKTKLILTTVLLWLTWPILCWLNPIPHAGDFAVAKNDGPLGLSLSEWGSGSDRPYPPPDKWGQRDSWFSGPDIAMPVSPLWCAVPLLGLLLIHAFLLAVAWNAASMFWRAHGAAQTASVLGYAAFTVLLTLRIHEVF